MWLGKVVWLQRVEQPANAVNAKITKNAMLSNFVDNRLPGVPISFISCFSDSLSRPWIKGGSKKHVETRFGSH